MDPDLVMDGLAKDVPAFPIPSRMAPIIPAPAAAPAPSPPAKAAAPAFIPELIALAAIVAAAINVCPQFACESGTLAAALPEKEKPSIIELTDRSQDSLCSVKGANNGTSEE